jgi:Protein of unknown function (DUF2934)
LSWAKGSQQENVMSNDLEQRIRERAYELWERAGRAHGQADAHWHTAKLELANTDPILRAEMIAVPAKAKPRRKSATPVEAVNTAAQTTPRRRRPSTTLAN